MTLTDGVFDLLIGEGTDQIGELGEATFPTGTSCTRLSPSIGQSQPPGSSASVAAILLGESGFWAAARGLPAPTPGPTPTHPPTVCIGDFHRSGDVTINEMITGLGIALGSTPLQVCSAFDRAGNGFVPSDELLTAVAASLNGGPT